MNKKYDYATTILGVDFITPEKVEKKMLVHYTNKQIVALDKTFPSKKTIRWYGKNNYAVVPTPPTDMSMSEIFEIKRISENVKYYTKGFGSHMKEDEIFRGWLAIKKEIVPNSTSKTLDEQKDLLSRFERIPSLAEISWFITVYFTVCGVRLLKNYAVRTSTRTDRFFTSFTIGHFNAESFDYTTTDFIISNTRDGCKYDNLGLLVKREQ